MSTYTPRSIQLFEGSEDFSLCVHLQSKYQTYYNHILYGDWPSSLYMLVRNEYSFCGNDYIIANSKIDATNIKSLIISHVFVPPKQSITRMSFCDLLCCRFD